MIRAIVILLAATLPLAGTKFKELPPGKGRAEVEAACYACHSADLLAQQRLTEKQWTASVDKMIRWGAVVKDEDKSVIIDYLSRHYGPSNRFVPEKTQPLTR
jgi:hypothetical protein